MSIKKSIELAMQQASLSKNDTKKLGILTVREVEATLEIGWRTQGKF